MYLWFVVTERRPLFDDVYQPHVMYTFQIKIYWKVTSLFSFEKTIYFILEKTLYCFDLSDGYFKVRFLQPMYLSGNAEKSKWIFSYILNSLFLKTRPRDNVSYDMDLDVLCLLFIQHKTQNLAKWRGPLCATMEHQAPENHFNLLNENSNSQNQ